MKAYSQDLRDRVMAAVDAAEDTLAEIALTFGLSDSTIANWVQRQRLTGQYAARAHAGGRQRTLAVCETLIRAALHAQPDLSLAELCARVRAEAGLGVSPSMMCRELKRLRLGRKKVAAR